MKIISCRHCGHEIDVYKKCDVCSKVKQFICNSCGNKTEEEIHSQCIMMSMDHALLSLN